MSKKSKPLALQYSERKSLPFWDAIWSLNSDEAFDAAYMMGCALQELEERVLTYVCSHLKSKATLKRRLGAD